jgi:rhomboid family GlyGly-CTERM serine protease
MRNPEHIETTPWWHAFRWTLLLTALIGVANVELLPAAHGTWPFAPRTCAFSRSEKPRICRPSGVEIPNDVPAHGRFDGLIEWLQFDRDAILAGQLWRLVTGNLVHWSMEHFLLDVGAFLVVGVMVEGHLKQNYLWILLAAAVAVGCGVLALAPEMTVYRGLSGVDSGQFAAALCIESAAALRDRRRWIWVAPAMSIFVLKIVYECTSGQMLFGTESLGDIGIPTPVAHAAGAAAAVALICGTMLVQSPTAAADRRTRQPATARV